MGKPGFAWWMVAAVGMTGCLVEEADVARVDLALEPMPRPPVGSPPGSGTPPGSVSTPVKPHCGGTTNLSSVARTVESVDCSGASPGYPGTPCTRTVTLTGAYEEVVDASCGKRIRVVEPTVYVDDNYWPVPVRGSDRQPEFDLDVERGLNQWGLPWEVWTTTGIYYDQVSEVPYDAGGMWILTYFDMQTDRTEEVPCQACPEE